jgi:hypothetical protein
MASGQLCESCNTIAIEQTLQELFAKLQNPESRDARDASWQREKESSERPWHSNLPAVLKSSATCALCKSILQGLREGRRQLVRDARFSGEWAETPNDFDDDILAIPYYSNAKPKVQIIAQTADAYERGNTMSAEQDIEKRLRARAIIRVTCGWGIDRVSSWDGYNEINCVLRISSQNGNESHLVKPGYC